MTTRRFSILAIIGLCLALIPLTPKTVMAEGNCYDDIFALAGGEIYLSSGYGGQAYLQNNKETFACDDETSDDFVRVYNSSTGKGVAAGYTRNPDLPVRAWFIFEDVGGHVHRNYRTITQDGLMRVFKVYRDRSKDPAVVWVGGFTNTETGTWYEIGDTDSYDLAYSKNFMSVYAETVYTADLLWGLYNDHADHYGFQYRDGNKVWHGIQINCENYNLAQWPHYQSGCPQDEVVGYFTTWDTRN